MLYGKSPQQLYILPCVRENKKNLPGTRQVRVFIIKCGTILRLQRLICLGSSSYRTRCITNETNLPNPLSQLHKAFFAFRKSASKLILLPILFDPIAFFIKLEAPKSLHWVACGTHYTNKEVTELGGIELQRSS